VIVALAGGVGAGKFLRGLAHVVDPEEITVIVNTGDDVILHGLHISPDVDSVIYWLAGVSDRTRGWGRDGESFRAMEALKRLGGESWFALGDLDLATHLMRTDLLSKERSLSETIEAVRRGFQVQSRILPMSDAPVTTRIDAVDDTGRTLDLHFQEYWVARGGRDEVKAVRYERGADTQPAPGVLEAIREADAVLICPSNPIASIFPILSLDAISTELRRRRDRAVAISPIVEGAPLRGMADRLMPAMGMEVSAVGVARGYRSMVEAFVIDERDVKMADTIRSALGMRVAAVDTIMVDDPAAERVARAALELVFG
jgi:LPPG:FO 2-phospho-L-lactate transferase